VSDRHLRQGTIVNVRFVPPRGVPKWRYCVVVTPDKLIDSQATIEVVGVTTSFFPGRDAYLPIPYHPDGNGSTRLREMSAIAFELTASVNKTDLTITDGFLPKSYVILMLEGIRRFRQIKPGKS
jgi:hypothetical protein